MSQLLNVYRAYLNCLNDQSWNDLGKFVSGRVRHNSREIGLAGYRLMLEQNYQEIPDLSFKSELVIVNDSYVACRLQFNCTPIGSFLGVPVNGRRVRFAENVFYEFEDGKIKEVWSVIDKVAIERQLM